MGILPTVAHLLIIAYMYRYQWNHKENKDVYG